MKDQTSQNMEQDGQGGVLDERSMIREQDRLARERKRKKNRRKKSIAGAVLLTLAVSGVWYLGWGRSLFAREPENQVDIKVREGQEIVYARLDSVRGNEVTYTIAEPSGEAETPEDGLNSEPSRPDENQEGERFGETGSGESGTEGDNSKREGAQGTFSQGAGTGRGHMEGRQQTGGADQADSGKLTFNSTGDQDAAGFPPDESMMVTGGFSGQFTYNNVTYRLTDETAAAQIPVGTDVTTKLGAVTTFSRLAAGDHVALIVENDGDSQIITAVYIIG